MDKNKKVKNDLAYEICLLTSSLHLTITEITIIVKIMQLYIQTGDANLLKWIVAFLGVTITSSITFDYIKDEYNESKNELIYKIGENYE